MVSAAALMNNARRPHETPWRGPMKTTRRLIAAALSLCSATWAAAAPPSGVLELFNRLPDAPASAEEAAKWIDKGGTLVHPGLLALKADIEAHRKAVAAALQAQVPAQQAQASMQQADLAKGMANVGIDMARMQSDPAYAQQVQTRMKGMSPDQLMAMSKSMAQPMNQNPNRRNEAKDMADDAPAVKSAAEAAFEYSNQQVTRIQAHGTRWQATEAEVKAKVYASPLKVDVPKPRIEYDNPGCDKACDAAWQAYAAKMLPQMIARDTQALKLRRDALQRERLALAPTIAQADKTLKAAAYGEKALSSTHMQQIAGYDQGMLGEIELLMTKTEEIARTASRTLHCGSQAVTVPMAVCR
jgi:hypothetical protein